MLNVSFTEWRSEKYLLLQIVIVIFRIWCTSLKWLSTVAVSLANVFSKVNGRFLQITENICKIMLLAFGRK